MTGVIFEPESRNSDRSDFASFAESDLNPWIVFSARIPPGATWSFDAGFCACATPESMATVAMTAQASTIDKARFLSGPSPGPAGACGCSSESSSESTQESKRDETGRTHTARGRLLGSGVVQTGSDGVRRAEAAVAAALAGARVILQARAAGGPGESAGSPPIAAEDKGASGDYVTEVDRASERAVVELLRAETG